MSDDNGISQSYRLSISDDEMVGIKANDKKIENIKINPFDKL